MAVDRTPPDKDDEPLDPLVEKAVTWLLHLHSGNESAEDWADYHAWKAAHPEHQKAADHAEMIWERIGSAPRSPSRKLPIILAASVGLAGLGFALGMFGEPRGYFAEYRTAVGEQRTITLADGSLVQADSSTSFDVEPDGRSITLYSGQVFVAVQGTGSAFSVHAAGGTTRTLGTKFAVRYDIDGVTAFVTESAVRVTYAHQPDRSVDVHAGQAISYSRRRGLQQVKEADIKALTAWQRGELSFKDRPLSEVVSELERYRRGRIILLGGDVRQMLVTAVFDVQDPDSALVSLSQALPITVHSLPGLAVIYRRPGPDTPP